MWIWVQPLRPAERALISSRGQQSTTAPPHAGRRMLLLNESQRRRATVVTRSGGSSTPNQPPHPHSSGPWSAPLVAGPPRRFGHRAPDPPSRAPDLASRAVAAAAPNAVITGAIARRRRTMRPARGRAGLDQGPWIAAAKQPARRWRSRSSVEGGEHCGPPR